jgi:hypothetical protein
VFLLSKTFWFRPDYRTTFAFIGQKARWIIGNYVTLSFVFIHIPGGSFIFNISMGKHPVSDLDQRFGEPPQWAQAGIFDYLHEHSIFAIRSHQAGAILG